MTAQVPGPGPAVDLSRVAVTGGHGMIGRALPWGVKLGRDQLDVRDRAGALRVLSGHDPSAILHLASMDIYRIANDPLLGFDTNVLGAYHSALAAREIGVPLVFLSSGNVFDGAAGDVHDETMRPSPVTLYGQSKWLAEQLLAETIDDLLIVRTSWVFGGHQAHHRKFVDVAIERAQSGEPIQATIDQQGSPTLVDDLINETGRLLATGERGVVHVVNEGIANGADIAREIVGALGSRSVIEEIHAADLSEPGPARPASEALLSSRTRLRPWREALREYVRDKSGHGSDAAR